MAGWDVDTHDFLVEGRAIETGGAPNADERIVGEDYFRLMRIGLKEGRVFRESDRVGGLPVAIINDTMARLYWPGRSPVGARIRLEHGYSRERLLSTTDAEGPWLTIVGVVKDARQRPDLLWEIRPEIDLPFLQSVDRIHNVCLVVGTASGGAGIVKAVRQEVVGLDPQVPVYGFTSATVIVDESHGPRRLALALLTLFGVLVLLLVIVGLYAVIAYNVSQRTREMGLRAAMGARPGDIVRMIVAQGVRLTIAGVSLGAVLAYGFARAMGNLLYGVGAMDPLTFCLVFGVLLMVALLASYVPARRATKVDPVVALRYE
jgi:putative ABC transport system permease protein